MGLLAIALVAFHEALRRPDRILIGHDMVQSFSWESHNRWSLSRGQLPLWNPFMFSGFPALADFQTQLLYPPAVALRWLPVPLFFTTLAIFHIGVAGIGTYVLCRALDVGRLAAMVAAIGFMLGGVFAPRIDAGHIPLIAAWSWLPTALWLAMRVARSGDWRGIAALSCVLTLELLAGQPQSTLYVLFAVALLFLAEGARAWRERDSLKAALRCVLRGALALLFALGLGAAQLLPTAVLVGAVARGEGLTFEAAARNSFGAEMVLTFLFPHAFPSLPPDPVEGVDGRYWEESSYVGLTAVLLAPLALLARRERWMLAYLWILALIALGLAAGKNLPLFSLHYALFPGLRHASRLIPLWSMAVAVLGATGLDQLARAPRARAAVAGYVLVASGTVLTLTLIPLFPDAPSAPGDAYGRSVAFVLVPLALLLLLLAPSLGKRARSWLLGALVLTVAVDLVSYAAGFIRVEVPPDRRSEVRDVTRLMEGIQPGRVIPLCDNLVSPDDLTVLRIPTIDGYNSFYFGDYARYGFLASRGAIPPDAKQPPRFWPFPDPPARPDLIRLLNVTHAIGCGNPRPVGYEVLGARRGGYVVQAPAPLDRALWMCRARVVGNREETIQAIGSRELDLESTVVLQGADVDQPDDLGCAQPARIEVIEKDRPDGLVRARVAASSPGLLFMSEPIYPERRAFMDGQEVPVLRANLAFSAVRVEPGEHLVELRLIPTSLFVGAAISGIAAAVLLVGLFWRPRRLDTAGVALRSL